MTYGQPDGPQEPQPTCYRHPDRPTLIRCVRCNRPICPECMRDAAVGFQCPDDAREGARSVRQARTAVGAPVRQPSNPAARWSPTPVTLTLVVLNVVAYIASGVGSTAYPGWPRPSLQDPRSSRLFNDWVLDTRSVHDNHEFYRLITSAFLHLSPVHIAMNVLSLLIIGPTLERMLGPTRYLAVYLLSALGGSTAVYLFDNNGAAGASGAIFGLFAVALIFARRLGLDMSWLAMTVAINFVITFSVSGISKWGHIGGFVVGGLAAVALTWLPPAKRIVKPQLQAAGLAAVLVLLVVAVLVRTQTAL